MEEHFICEVIKPVTESIDARSITRGEPGLPMRFVWRGTEYAVDRVLEKWKESSGCRSGRDERYTRKHWFRIRTSDDKEMTIFFERQPRSARQAKQRWWLHTLFLPERE